MQCKGRDKLLVLFCSSSEMEKRLLRKNRSQSRSIEIESIREFLSPGYWLIRRIYSCSGICLRGTGGRLVIYGSVRRLPATAMAAAWASAHVLKAA